ncbi:hypothetical protein NE237_007018 [Protea cynaroides]|uniref:Retrovirus-related Pol polyprotein from transposon TNT 1-94-like beta-barrel domain-containing protein n=1 Tax=Protea cynaroides TaxID=273540 RepID=A0A9Q0QW25_9MAGN|nr:hypothetical protein NE237_007018 [Protea cynaroides]
MNKKTPPVVRKVWKKKIIADFVEEKNDGVTCFETTFKTQDKLSPWILDSGCSSHMTGDKKMFQQLQQYEGGIVKFGNNEGAKVTGKGSISINNGKVKLHDVFYVSGLKHNVFSISQICDRGHEVIFNKQGCEIKRVDSGKIVASGQRTSRNLYTLIESVEDSCMTMLIKQ